MLRRLVEVVPSRPGMIFTARVLQRYLHGERDLWRRISRLRYRQGLVSSLYILLVSRVAFFLESFSGSWGFLFCAKRVLELEVMMCHWTDKTNHFSSNLSIAIISFLYPQPLIFSFTHTDGRIAPRSGLASKNFIDTGAGVIDADYRGQVKVLLFNHSDLDFEGKFPSRPFFQEHRAHAVFPCRRILWEDEAA